MAIQDRSRTNAATWGKALEYGTGSKTGLETRSTVRFTARMLLAMRTPESRRCSLGLHEPFPENAPELLTPCRQRGIIDAVSSVAFFAIFLMDLGQHGKST
jgi:hypothetical protein